LAANIQGDPLSFLRSRRGVAFLAALCVLILFLVRPGADHLKGRITRAIGTELRRSVDIGSVSVRVLPTPGFDLKKFVLYDDQAFGAEPMMQAAEVTASIRVSSLLRGRLEIARLDLTEPSINLVRSPEGHWNLETLLQRAAQTPLGPTAKVTKASGQAFPYVEADGGRINVKIGLEKKSYALTNADFSLWQDTENTWAMRLKAQPMRTDFNLTDTGELKVNGTWRRASNLRETPLQFSVQWSDAQLGELTKFVYGRDKGWRGSVKLVASLSGAPGDLNIDTDVSVQDFRRYDILGGDAVRLHAVCNGHYSTAEKSLSNLSCRGPVGEGAVTLSGAIHSINESPDYDLALAADSLPLQSVAAFMVHMKKDLPQDLSASGKLNANIEVLRTKDGEVGWSGDGEALGLKLTSPSNETNLSLSRIPFAVRSNAKKDATALANRLEIGPLDLALGRPAPASVHGWISTVGYEFSIQGDTQIKKLLQLARTVGVRTPQVAADGGAKIDLQLAGAWAGFSPPLVNGKAVLHSVRAEVRGVNAPLEIASGTVVLTPNNINVLYLSGSLGTTQWKGAVAMPRPCVPPDACSVHFDLRADQLATDELNQIVNPAAAKRPWYKFLSSSAVIGGKSYLATLEASGKLATNRLDVHGLTAMRVSGNVEMNRGKLRISDLHGDVLGGKHSGELRADFTGKVPEYSGTGTLDQIVLGQLGDLMHDAWVTGTASLNYKASASGVSAAELFSSASATVLVDAHDGTLAHLALPNSAPPLRMHSFSDRMVLRRGVFEIQEGKLETPSGIYQVSGKASLGRVLDVKLARDGAHGFNISGTLNSPKVSPATNAETEAALKP
jgi:uncharacterized protein involved in outer membrane biogenesis